MEVEQLSMDEQTPKRGRGRPPKSSNPPTDKPPAGHEAVAPRGKKSYAGVVRDVLLPLNLVLLSLPMTRADALTADELRSAVELGDKAAQRYAPVRKFFERASDTSIVASAISLAVAIGGRVAMNHNLLPPAFVAYFQAMQQGPAGSDQASALWEQVRNSPEFQAAAAETAAMADPVGYAEYTGGQHRNGLPTVAPVFPPR